MNGKGRGPEKGYNRQAYAENYDAIFRTNQRKEPMKTPEQEQPNQPTILPWHREAAKEIYDAASVTHYPDTYAAIIAAHDPHAAQEATTLRLLERAEPWVDSETKLSREIRAHLAATKGTNHAN